MTVAPWVISGSQEVVGDLNEDEAAEAPNAVPGGHRPSIDNMIEQLQREQDQRLAVQNRGPMSPPPPPPQHPGSSPRLSRSNSGRSQGQTRVDKQTKLKVKLG